MKIKGKTKCQRPGLLASEDTYCDWQDEELHPDNEPYEVYKYVLEEKEE